MTAARVRSERADARHVDALTPLFAAYRRFYGRPADPRARLFLEKRLARGESVVFMALLGRETIGFSQLYPNFASVSLARMFVLYDQSLAPGARREGSIRDQEFYLYSYRLAAPTESGPQE